MSFIDLLNVPYPQPPPVLTSLDNTQLRSSVGENASLLSTQKTLEMYRANVKKTNDPTIQYTFAELMIRTAQEMANSGQEFLQDQNGASGDKKHSPKDLLREARQILQKLSDRSHPYAQYYLGDGYASGLFNKGVEDNDRAFPLFIAASKHGHAEAGYRTALCYEFGWGTRKDVLKAVQFYRQSASKNHPGAMARLGRACLVGDLGLGTRYREGLKWLKRAAESADTLYNSAPYELGLLHETGYGDDIFRDEAYAAQLFTQSADLGHVDANYRLGDSYEHGKLSCPRDPALSVHFYTGAAQQGHPLAMMALCAWYMVGAEPVLDKDEGEACEWARRAAETGMYAVFITLSILSLFVFLIRTWTWTCGLSSPIPQSIIVCIDLLHAMIIMMMIIMTSHKAWRKRSTPSATSRRWASAAAATRSRLMSGTSARPTRAITGPPAASPPSELRLRVGAKGVVGDPRGRRRRRRRRRRRYHRRRRRGGGGGFFDICGSVG